MPGVESMESSGCDQTAVALSFQNFDANFKLKFSVCRIASYAPPACSPQLQRKAFILSALIAISSWCVDMRRSMS